MLTKSEWKTVGLWSGIALCLSISGYFANRYLFSNMDRDLQLNSGNREAALVITLPQDIANCESNAGLIKLLEAQLAQAPEGTQAYTLAYNNLLGTQQALDQCVGTIRAKLDSANLENVPELEDAISRFKVLEETR